MEEGNFKSGTDKKQALLAISNAALWGMMFDNFADPPPNWSLRDAIKEVVGGDLDDDHHTRSQLCK